MEQVHKTISYQSVEEYFVLRSASEARYEYDNGVISKVSPAGIRHREILTNLSDFFQGGARGKNCDLWIENACIEVLKDRKYYCPDLALSVHSSDSPSAKIIRHPALLIEVGSSSARPSRYPRKFTYYLQIPSLKYYLAVDQQQCRVEFYSRSNNSTWFYQLYERPVDTIRCPTLDIVLALSDIYKNIRFDTKYTDEY